MKNELKSYFQDIIFISEIDDKLNIVTLKTIASKILYNLHQQTQQREYDEKNHIIEAIAKLIKQRHLSDKGHLSLDYLPIDTAMRFLPRSLLLFCETDSRSK